MVRVKPELSNLDNRSIEGSSELSKIKFIKYCKSVLSGKIGSLTSSYIDNGNFTEMYDFGSSEYLFINNQTIYLYSDKGKISYLKDSWNNLLPIWYEITENINLKP